MPQRRKPQSLRTICMWQIIKNLPIYSTKELQNLPNILSEELIDLYNEELLKNDEILCYAYRNRLIKQNMKKLKLLLPYECKPLITETLIIVLATCNNLTHFSCNFSNKPRVYLHQLVISMPNLIELKLCIGEAEEDYKDLKYDDDDILEAIGNNCFQLEILHFNYSRVTDDGVRRFCQSNTDTGGRIKELNLDEGQVEINGCLTALRDLKQMRRFYCRNRGLDQVLEAFKKLCEDSMESPIPIFQLCEFRENFFIDDMPTKFVNFVTACCPNKRDLRLKVRNNFDRHVKDFKSCNENVCLHLDIRFLRADNLTENLGYVGCRITELNLFACDVHLPTIGFICPNLTDLSLCGVKYLPVNYVAGNNFEVAYCKLLKLNLDSEGSLPIPIQQLQFLLQNCFELTKLIIECNNEFTDDVMFRILHGVNPLRHLNRFELFYCNAVSSVAILELLQADNELTSLRIILCEKINRNERSQIKSVINENNFCVTLEVVND